MAALLLAVRLTEVKLFWTKSYLDSVLFVLFFATLKCHAKLELCFPRELRDKLVIVIHDVTPTSLIIGS